VLWRPDSRDIDHVHNFFSSSGRQSRQHAPPSHERTQAACHHGVLHITAIRHNITKCTGRQRQIHACSGYTTLHFTRINNREASRRSKASKQTRALCVNCNRWRGCLHCCRRTPTPRWLVALYKPPKSIPPAHNHISANEEKAIPSDLPVQCACGGERESDCRPSLIEELSRVLSLEVSTITHQLPSSYEHA
jgi:hypothetical protein